MAIAIALWLIALCGAMLIVALSIEDLTLPWPARRRARELFLSRLDDRQRRSWTRYRYFEVRAQSGRRYTVFSYGPFNIRRHGTMFCVRVDGRVPVYDKLLAQQLLIESDERLFLQLANTR